MYTLIYIYEDVGLDLEKIAPNKNGLRVASRVSFMHLNQIQQNRERPRRTLR